MPSTQPAPRISSEMGWAEDVSTNASPSETPDLSCSAQAGQHSRQKAGGYDGHDKVRPVSAHGTGSTAVSGAEGSSARQWPTIDAVTAQPSLHGGPKLLNGLAHTNDDGRNVDPSASTSDSTSAAPPASTSLREIRRNVDNRRRLSMLETSDLTETSPRNQLAQASPTSPRNLTPRSAGQAGAARGHLHDDSDDSASDVGAPRADPSSLGQRRRRNRRMTVLDFLAAEPPPPSTAPPERRSSALLEAPRAGMTASNSGHSLQVPDRRAAADPNHPPMPSSSSSPALTVPASIRQRIRPRSMIATSPTKVRQPRDAIVSREPASGGLSALEFLASSPPHARRTGSDEDNRARAASSLDAPGTSHLRHRSSATALEGQEQQFGERAAVRRRRGKTPAEEVTVTVQPSTDLLTMFGSTQSSANYSLSGTVIVTLPRPRAAKNGPSVGESGREGEISSGAERCSDPVSDETTDLAGEGPSTAASSQHRELVTLKSLKLLFSGFSLYADLSGRFSGIKLCEVSHDLFEEGATLPVPPSSHEEQDATASVDPVKYEIQFDLNVPGWLPGSASSRFGATFYCIGAAALVSLPDGSEIVAQSTSDSQLNRELLRASESLSPAISAPTDQGERNVPQARLPEMGPAAEETRPQTSQVGLSSSIDTPASRQRSKATWLRRAKQISNKGKAPTGSSDQTVSQRSISASTRKALLSKLDGSGRFPQPDGSLLIKSEKRLIIVRRCREVVPVPVARLAIIGDHLPEGSQDSPQRAARTADAGPQATPASTSDATPSAAPSSPSVPTPSSPVRAAVADDLPTRPATSHNAPFASMADHSRSQSNADSPLTEAAGETVAAGSSHSASMTPASQQLDAACPANRPTSIMMQATTSAHSSGTPLPVAPSIFNAPSDPSKLAAASHYPPPPARTSSTIQEGAARPAAPSTGSNAPPMRHFLHRPVLHPPTDSGILESEGLPFSLTISVPSHVQAWVDMLTFGIQVEVGRTSGWAKVRESGGLRLRDMELICTQSERHTSVPSRTFCATFPVPPEPKIKASELPVLPKFTPPIDGRPLRGSHDVKVRNGYDVEPLLSHLAMQETGKILLPEENDVERIRSNVVGPPPGFQKNRFPGGNPTAAAGEANKEKERNQRRGRASQSAATATANGGVEDTTNRSRGSNSPANSQPRNLFADPMSSTAAAPPLPASGSVLAQANDVFGGSLPSRNSRRGPRVLNDMGSRSQPGHGGFRSASATEPAATRTDSTAADNLRRPSLPPLTVPQTATSPSSPSSPVTPRRLGRGRRAYEAALRGLSTFATAMMEVGYDENETTSATGGEGSRPGGQQQPAGQDGLAIDHDQPRASYTFPGDDGHGVDLSKGRIRMTVHLPLVSASATTARREGTPQLVADYESPHMRIRHKLKVKLGFGFGAKPLGGESDWGQALVMCVPVRFIESTPREVLEQFAPMPITVTSGDNSTIQPTINVAEANGAPILPAYTQLFRDDGSRLNEAEELPAYPGPRKQSQRLDQARTPGSPRISSRPSFLQRPSMPHRGSVTGPLSPSLAASMAADMANGPSATGSAHNAGGSSSGAGGKDATLPDGRSALSSPPRPPLNSLAPEAVVDDALRAITDPDESLAEIREQERELRELEQGEDEDREDLAAPVPEQPAAQSTLGSRLRARSFISIGGRRRGLSSASTVRPAGNQEPLVSMSTAAVGSAEIDTAAAAQRSYSLTQAPDGMNMADGDTVLVGPGGNEDEARIRAVEEELGL
ncbi:unnamed protein product [Parajaminaea phylloscopi]